MIEIPEAYAILRRCADSKQDLSSDLVLASQASGRILADDLHCAYDHPPFAQSAMDGIAFRWAEGLTQLTCVGTIAAGDAPGGITELAEGTCVRIMTGAPVPDCADAVEMVEQLEWDGSVCRLKQAVQRGQHIRHRAENIRAGDPLYSKGTVIGSGVVAGLISQGYQLVPVSRPLRVGIAATGNELTQPGMALAPGQIYNSNTPSLASLLKSPAVAVTELGVLPDDSKALRRFLEGNKGFDVLILSGGVSMGKFDLVPEAAMAAGFVQQFHKVRMKPGKPIWFGTHPAGSAVFGLPGNPVSVMVGAMLFVRPYLQALVTGCFNEPGWVSVPILNPVANSGGLPLFCGVQFETTAEGTLAVVLPMSGSGDILHFSQFTTLCRLSAGSALKRGEKIEVLLPFPLGIS